MTVRNLLLMFVLTLAFPALGSAQTLPNKDKPVVVQVKKGVFKSRREVAKHLGEFIADGIPPSFNFKIFALVWAGLPVNKNASVVIKTLPAENSGFQSAYSLATALTVSRTTAQVIIEIWSDNPCSGGDGMFKEQERACELRVRNSVENAKKTAMFFATPRHKLKRVKLERRQVPGRP